MQVARTVSNLPDNSPISCCYYFSVLSRKFCLITSHDFVRCFGVQIAAHCTQLLSRSLSFSVLSSPPIALIDFKTMTLCFAWLNFIPFLIVFSRLSISSCLVFWSLSIYSPFQFNYSIPTFLSRFLMKISNPGGLLQLMFMEQYFSFWSCIAFGELLACIQSTVKCLMFFAPRILSDRTLF